MNTNFTPMQKMVNVNRENRSIITLVTTSHGTIAFTIIIGQRNAIYECQVNCLKSISGKKIQTQFPSFNSEKTYLSTTTLIKGNDKQQHCSQHNTVPCFLVQTKYNKYSYIYKSLIYFRKICFYQILNQTRAITM